MHTSRVLFLLRPLARGFESYRAHRFLHFFIFLVMPLKCGGNSLEPAVFITGIPAGKPLHVYRALFLLRALDLTPGPAQRDSSPTGFTQFQSQN
jgi:hypothetical protein